MSKNQKLGVVNTKLMLAERLRLLAVLPPVGGLATVRLVRELRERLSFGKEEAESLGAKTVGESITWNPEKDKGREFSFGGFEVELIISALRKLDTDKTMTPDLVPLWDVFVDGKSEEGGG